jgi:ribosomal subunit interface protein
MQILVEGKKLPITAAMRAFVYNQANKLAKLGVKITQIRVFLENVARKKGEANRSEVLYKIEMPGKNLVVEKKGHDVYSAVVAATDRVKLQLARLKQKHLEKSRGK